MIDLPDPAQYLALMAACLVITLPLEIVLGARVYRRPIAAVRAIGVTVILFSVWDILAIRASLWTFSEQFTTGIILPAGLPLEELVFFIAIPLCGILTYEAVGRVLKVFSPRRRPGGHERQEADHA